jgi:hypothetical protein
MLERGKNLDHVKDYRSAANENGVSTPGSTTSEQKEKYPVIHWGWAYEP